MNNDLGNLIEWLRSNILYLDTNKTKYLPRKRT